MLKFTKIIIFYTVRLQMRIIFTCPSMFDT